MCGYLYGESMPRFKILSQPQNFLLGLGLLGNFGFRIWLGILSFLCADALFIHSAPSSPSHHVTHPYVQGLLHVYRDSTTWMS